MSTIPGRTGRALLVIDVQEGVFATVHDRDAVVTRIAGLVDRARAEGTPVVWIQQEDEGDLRHGSDGWRIAAPLAPADGEAVVAKTYGDAFDATSLESVLADLDASEVVVCGGQTDACVRSTLHGAFVRGYDVTLVGDAHTTEDLREWDASVPGPAEVIAHTNLSWRYEDGAGRVARVVDAEEVVLS
ncbi:isochorismatase family protein [Agrococcus sp. SGAir0287]|uniref:isochorismatase family protein n=1 Tax=Agrococcus sp. SGAir0287 TaxID=2070347 RepID=UPI0010CD4110|nr:isochorismatase family protein [Agrococcus sp. SGAir0287]QCR18555.1 cysteine hydrolase [Agrococcus sp. SGAir0287]